MMENPKIETVAKAIFDANPMIDDGPDGRHLFEFIPWGSAANTDVRSACRVLARAAIKAMTETPPNKECKHDWYIVSSHTAKCKICDEIRSEE